MVDWKKEIVSLSLIVLLVIPTEAFTHYIEDFFNWNFEYWYIRGCLLFVGCFLYIRLITSGLDWLEK